MNKYCFRSRIHTAIHEAGHAVANERLGIMQICATIKPSDETAGHVEGEGENHVWSRDEAGAMVRSFCAGYAALVVFGFDDETARWGTGSDFEKAETLLDYWSLDGNLEFWLKESVALLSQPTNIAAIDRIAAELLARETIDYDDLAICVDVADGQCTEAEYEQFKTMRAS